jgi:hypothetical protein
MMAYSAKNRKPFSDSPKSFKEIIQAAIVLSRLLEKSLSSGDKKQPRWVHRPDRPYTQQEVVHLCCLVDVQRPLSVDTQYNETIGEIRLSISSYKLNPSEKLETYMKQKNKELDAESMNFYVYRPWLKKYLDWFNPALYQYITTHLDGVKVQRFQHRLAAEDQDSYDQQGRLVHDKLLVPLPKMHRVVSTKDDFGVVKADGSFEPYCKDTYASNISLSQPVRHPTYDDSLTAGCNPANFEYVPVARMPRVDVPAHHMQIKAIRAQIKRDKQKNVTVRWLGLQGGKYVSLPPDWVTDNFDPIVLDEAQRRAQNEEDGLTGHLPERFLVIPPGDSRDDDPPFGLRHNRGLNYYYQGTVDNCVMGGLVNAVYWWLGQDLADELLKSKHTLGVKDFWMLFVRHVNGTLQEYNLKRFTCIDILRTDDATPMVVQLRSKDKSESHAICIFQGCI